MESQEGSLADFQTNTHCLMQGRRRRRLRQSRLRRPYTQRRNEWARSSGISLEQATVGIDSVKVSISISMKTVLFITKGWCQPAPAVKVHSNWLLTRYPVVLFTGNELVSWHSIQGMDLVVEPAT